MSCLAACAITDPVTGRIVKTAQEVQEAGGEVFFVMRQNDHSQIEIPVPPSCIDSYMRGSEAIESVFDESPNRPLLGALDGVRDNALCGLEMGAIIRANSDAEGKFTFVPVTVEPTVRVIDIDPEE